MALDEKEYLKQLKDQYIKALKMYNDQLNIYVSRDLDVKVDVGRDVCMRIHIKIYLKKYSISKSKVQSIAEKFNLTHTKMKNETPSIGVLGSYISY